jgi:polyisoprenoid-binding protein YceI
MQLTQARTAGDTATIQPGVWEVDPSHSTVQFVSRHLMVAKVRGGFDDFSGSIEVAEKLEDSSVRASIVAASIDTGDTKRDEHLRSPDFLDVDNFPAIEFRSTEVRSVNGDRWQLGGELSIRGITRPVTLDVDFNGTIVDPWGKQRLVFSAVTTVNREDFGLTWNQALESGGVLVGKDVRLELEVEAVRK